MWLRYYGMRSVLSSCSFFSFLCNCVIYKCIYNLQVRNLYSLETYDKLFVLNLLMCMETSISNGFHRQ